MIYNKIWRIVILPVFIIAVVATAVISYRGEENSCMGVRILTDAETSRFTNYVPQEISGWIVCDGQAAAVDSGTFTVYISQNINETTEYKDLVGKLGIENPGWEIYFAEDEMFSDLDTAVKNNHTFRLIIATGEAEYMEYGVVFTTLPVIRMDGEKTYTTSDGEVYFGGDITLWDGNYAGTGGYIVEKSDIQWTDNDQRDLDEAKYSWKVSLENSNGSINMLNLFGLGKDDDWIMNSIYGDDTKVREQLAAKLWNEMAADRNYNLKTPEGAYAEVIFNGEYQGLYSISRKIDQKYLKIDSDDLLLRDKKYPRGSYVQNNYSILEGYYTEEEIWQIVKPFHTQEDMTALNIDSWIDANLFVEIMYNKGKRGYAEMYWLYNSAATRPSIEMMPVGEDALLGVTYRDGKFVFDSSLASAEVNYRTEYSRLKQLYPDLDGRIAERYRYLRENIFDKETIYSFINHEYQQLEKSGAAHRDAQRWDTAAVNDSTEFLKKYIEERFAYLDEKYADR